MKKLTILHSNDMHGDFLSQQIDDKLLGGISRLSGYIQKVRREEKNVIYAIAGDMFRGSLIDSEYKGLSTVEMMNLLSPDVVTLGNHEVDYGLAHLLFIEKCAKFPIINANMYIIPNHKRLFNSHHIIEIDGMKVLFIGVLTEDVLDAAKQDKLIGSLVDVKEAAEEVGKICNSYKSVDIDFTVLLTHIGFEADKKLAEALDPRWGVDIIIGGHSHTLLDKPVEVAGIPIVQAACGTAQVGRFDIEVDTDNNCISSYTWELIPIDAENCPRDTALERVLLGYKEKTDEKYGRIVTRFAECYTHPERSRQTKLGMLLADAMKEMLGLDLMILGSGSIRKEEMGPIVTHGDFAEVLPYHDPIYMLTLNWAQVRHMIEFALLDNREAMGIHEAYQFSEGIRAVFSKKDQKLINITLNGREPADEDVLKVGLQEYHLCSIKKFLDISPEEAEKIRKPKLISTNCTDAAEEYFSNMEFVKAPEEERVIKI